VAFYLAQFGWSPAHIGLALSVGGVAGMISQIPGGALADAVTWKRGLAAAGIIMTGVAALILAFAPDMVSVFIAQVLQGATAGIITPAIGAISLGLVGRSAMSVRTGRNFRYSAFGHALTGALMGVVGAYIAKGAIFIAAAALCIPALIALSFVRSDEIDYARARNAKIEKQSDPKGSGGKQAGGKPVVTATSIFALAKNPALVLFTAATVLFQLADTSMLPMMGENLATTRGSHAAIWMSGLIVVPQVAVAILAPWAGFHSEKRGRRPLLLIGFALEPVRGLLLAATAAYPALVLAQVLSGAVHQVLVTNKMRTGPKGSCVSLLRIRRAQLSEDTQSPWLDIKII
jgi:MFS family permease